MVYPTAVTKVLFEKLRDQSRFVIGITGSQHWAAAIYPKDCDTLFCFEGTYRLPGNVFNDIEITAVPGLSASAASAAQAAKPPRDVEKTNQFRP